MVIRLTTAAASGHTGRRAWHTLARAVGGHPNVLLQRFADDTYIHVETPAHDTMTPTFRQFIRDSPRSDTHPWLHNPLPSHCSFTRAAWNTPTVPLICFGRSSCSTFFGARSALWGQTSSQLVHQTKHRGGDTIRQIIDMYNFVGDHGLFSSYILMTEQYSKIYTPKYIKTQQT